MLRRLNLADWLFALYLASSAALIVGLHREIHVWILLFLLHFAGLAVILLLANLAPRLSVINFLHDWYPLVLPIATFEEVAFLSRQVFPGWRDHLLLAFESKLFSVPPTVWFSQHASWWLTEILEVGYFSYYLFLIVVGGVLYARADKRPFRSVMAASALSYLMCYIIFIAFPTEGPAHTLAALHSQPPPGGPFHAMVAFIQRQAGVHGNAFPSSHVAAALVALFYAWRYAPRLARTLTPFAVLLCLGAVYDRYHYVSDVAGGVLVGLAATGLAWKFSTAFTR